jgi:hypothetical protein
MRHHDRVRETAKALLDIDCFEVAHQVESMQIQDWGSLIFTRDDHLHADGNRQRALILHYEDTDTDDSLIDKIDAALGRYNLSIEEFGTV